MPTKTSVPNYKPADVAFARIPLLPADFVLGLFRGPRDSPLDVDKRILDAAALPEVREALVTATRGVEHAIRHLQEGKNPKKVRRARTTLLRYLIRMATKPTPFGTFAGVSPVFAGASTNITVAETRAHKKHSRPDMMWLADLVRELCEPRTPGWLLSYQPNPLILRFGGRVTLPHLDLFGRVGEQRATSLRDTRPVSDALQLAFEGANLKELALKLRELHPRATTEQVEGLVADLKNCGFLVPDLIPPITTPDPVNHIITTLSTIPGYESSVEGLRRISSLINRFDAEPLGQGIALYDQLCAESSDLITAASSPPILQVDLETTLSDSSISRHVLDEVAAAARVLLRIGGSAGPMEHLQAYRRAFERRYERQEVPLLELLDEDAGLGPPETYIHPARRVPLDTSDRMPDRKPARERLSYLLALLERSMLESNLEIALTEDDIQALEDDRAGEPGADRWPPSLEVFASISATSAGQVDRGQYLVVIGPATLTDHGGKSISRFSHMLGAEASRVLERSATLDQAHNGDTLVAELAFLPARGQAQNVAVRPSHYDAEISVLPTYPGGKTVLRFDDLVVGVSGDRFYLRSLALGVEVLFRTTCLLNPLLGSNVCRFLLEVSQEKCRIPGPFSWGELEAAPFLPRIRFKRAILRPAQWRFDPRTLEPDRDGDTQTAFEEWRSRWRVPRFVFVTDVDSRLWLDLDDERCKDLLLQEGRSVVLQEMLPDFAGLWARDEKGSAYFTEFVVPLFQELPERETVVRRRWTTTTVADPTDEDRYKYPGSEWGYVKLYGPQFFQDDVISLSLLEASTGLRQQGRLLDWFFVRYADPDPHLRVRFRSTVPAEAIDSFNQMARELVERGVLRKFSWETYEREIERYGGVAAIEAAEGIFTADSFCTAHLIRAGRARQLSRSLDAIAIASVDSLTRSLGADTEGVIAVCRLLLTDQIVTERRELSRAYRAEEDELWAWWMMRDSSLTDIEKSILDQGAVDLLQSQRLLLDLQVRQQISVPAVDFLTSISHMHLNRLFGLDRRRERTVAYRLMRLSTRSMHV